MKRYIFEFKDENTIDVLINKLIDKVKFKIDYIYEQIYFDKSKIRNFRVYIYGDSSKDYFYVERNRIISEFHEIPNLEDLNILAIIEQGFFLYPDDKEDKKTPAKHRKHVILYTKKNESKEQ